MDVDRALEGRGGGVDQLALLADLRAEEVAVDDVALHGDGARGGVERPVQARGERLRPGVDDPVEGDAPRGLAVVEAEQTRGERAVDVARNRARPDPGPDRLLVEGDL